MSNLTIAWIFLTLPICFIGVLFAGWLVNWDIKNNHNIEIILSEILFNILWWGIYFLIK